MVSESAAEAFSNHSCEGVLTLTHSSRMIDLERCSRAFLRARFGQPSRLTGLPPAASLKPAAALYSGGISFYRVSAGQAGSLAVTPLGGVRHRDRIQHAVLTAADTLMVGYQHRLECWWVDLPPDSSTKIKAELCWTFEHPWLVALHTIAVTPDKHLLLSCSSADAVLRLDPQTRTVNKQWRLPAHLYGSNYDLNSDHDLRRHYIPDMYQLAHVNSADITPCGQQIVVSGLIGGIVGTFDVADDRYEERVRGFDGCHGARFDSNGGIYFTDSCSGTLVTVGPGGAIDKRFKVRSAWLHDVLHITGDVFAFALADSNELHIIDTETGTTLYQRSFAVTNDDEPRHLQSKECPGNSTQFLSFWSHGNEPYYAVDKGAFVP